MEPKIEKLAGIPIAVVHQANPYRWKVAPLIDPTQPHVDPALLTQRFVASAIKVPMRRWKSGIELPGPSPLPRYFDGRAVREEFMDLKTDSQAFDFLNRYGNLSPLRELELTRGWRVADIKGWQQVFGELARRQPETWQKYADGLIQPHSGFDVLGVVSALSLGSNHQLEFRWQADPHIDWFGAKHVAFLRTTDVISSVLATIEIDHLRGATFGVCHRHDCPRFFEITSLHKRKYCSQSCAHLESMRRTRKKRKAKHLKTRRKDSTRAGPT